MAEPAASQDPGPKPGEVRIDVDALNGSDEAAGAALAGLFTGEEDSTDLPEGQGPSAETGQEETPATGDTEDGHSEQDAGPAIEPPATWTAEEKQAFDELPPEAKAALGPILRRESERENLLSKQGQKAAEAAKAFESQLAQVADERAKQVQFFNAIALKLTPELQRFQQMNWQELAATKPAEWAVQSQAYQDTIKSYTDAMHASGQLQQANQAEAEKKHQEFLTTERVKLIAAIPEFADPLKGKAYAEELMKHIPEFTVQEWNTVSDHRYFPLARDAMLWRKSQAARKEADKRRVPANQSNARTLRPAARQEGSAAETAAKKELTALHGKLAKSGSTKDAANLLEGILS